MKILLINPPISVEDVYGKYSNLASFQPPIGLCALAGYLLYYRYDVKIIDASVSGMSILDVVKDVKKFNPQLIGIYTNTSNYYVVTRLTDAIKEAHPSGRIVLGGPHPTFLPKDSLQQTRADYVVMGEGEETLLELVRFIEHAYANLSGVKGLAFKDRDNNIVINAPRERIQDLDRLPFPAVHLLPPLKNYKLYLLQYKRLPYMTLMTSRGCPYKCVFCNTPFGKITRFNSPEYITSYIEYLSKEFGVKELHFCDDTFTLNEDRIVRMCELIQKKKLDVTWYSATRANFKNKELFKLMKRAGCWTCAIGVESGDPAILRLIGKTISLDEVRATCNSAVDAGLIVKAFFIIGNPGETVESIERSIRFAQTLNVHYPVFSLMTPYPGAELWDTAEQYGTFDRSNFQKLLISTSDPVFVPFGLTKELLIRKQKEALRRVYLTPRMIQRQLAAIHSFADVKKLGKAAIEFLKLQYT